MGEIVSRFERKGLKLVVGELRTIDEATAGRHYEEHVGKPFYGDLVDFITRSPSFVFVVEGPEDTWKVVRTMMGVTNPRDAAPGTIRGDLGPPFPIPARWGAPSLPTRHTRWHPRATRTPPDDPRCSWADCAHASATAAEAPIPSGTSHIPHWSPGTGP